jgi:hypothetical protein
MIDLGINIFKRNLVQCLFIVFCLGISIWAKSLSIQTLSMSLQSFISTSVDNMFSEENSFSVWFNVVLPSVLYLISCALLLWMSVTNFFTLQYEESKFHLFLKGLLGACQAILFGWFLFVGGKLLFYLIAFTLLILFCVSLLSSSSSPQKN